MFGRSEKPQYLPVIQDGNDGASLPQWVDEARSRGHSYFWSTVILAAILAVSLATNAILLNRQASCLAPELELWTDELSSLPPRQRIQFDASIMPHSKFTGYGPDVDAEWDRFTENDIIDGTAVVLAVTKDDIVRSGKYNDEHVPFDTTVRIGQQYMGTVELFHQLHCLNVLRKYVHYDYYKDTDRFFSSHDIGNHSDHCVEMIRQVIMCNSDHQLITFHWVDGWQSPVPDFNTWHTCRDPEQILQWAHDRAAPVYEPIRKPAGVKALPHRP